MTREPLVTEERLARAWDVITSRVPGRLDLAAPDAYIQPASEKVVDGKVVRTVPVAVFTVAEPNPRYSTPKTPILQVSATHMPLAGWLEMEKEASHFVAKGFDPLHWCLMMAAKGHLHTMDNIRSMTHAVTRINERGEREVTHPTGH